MKIIIFLMIFIGQSFASPYLFKFYPKGTKVVGIGAFNLENEREFEKGEDIIENLTLSGTGLNFLYGHYLSEKDYLEISISALAGKYEEVYSHELAYLGNRDNKVFGVREPVITYLRKFNTVDDHHYNHGLKIAYSPSFNMAKQTNFMRGHHELEINYWFSYRRKNYEMAGQLYSRYFTEKKIELSDMGSERSSPYSEVGIELMPAFIYNEFAIRAIGGTGNTTDYNTKNDQIERKSDKGFSVYGGGSLEYDNEDFAANLTFIASSYVFNSIDEDMARDVDFEFENREISLNFLWRLR
ncbi:hypothetical protein [Bacteriovorax sp. BSW11_IV]|uniref:hypothetical protein n=1 Tax=Bacteriovorax sp. BSW11_IV TaxID=1353529 RepID=UPI0012DDD52F|nr:hypothetical protein [Bacteriovorax sp. BSW11_IV]